MKIHFPTDRVVCHATRMTRPESNRLWGPQKATFRCGFPPGKVHTARREIGRITDGGGQVDIGFRPPISVRSSRALSIAVTTALTLASTPLAAQAPGEPSAVIAPEC